MPSSDLGGLEAWHSSAPAQHGKDLCRGSVPLSVGSRRGNALVE